MNIEDKIYERSLTKFVIKERNKRIKAMSRTFGVRMNSYIKREIDKDILNKINGDIK